MEESPTVRTSFTKVPEREVRVRYGNRAAWLVFFICFSPLYYGYSLTIIGASNFSLLYEYYSIPVSPAVTLALLNGALPLGGMLGSLYFAQVSRLTTKKYFCSN